MTEQTETTEKSNRKLHTIYLAIIFLLSGGCIFLALQVRTMRTTITTHEIQIEQVTKQKDDVSGQLMDLKESYSQLKTNDAALNKKIDEQKQHIDSLLQEAEKHKNDAYVIAKLKKETNTLRLIMQGYVHEIDSLNQLNGKLVADKQQVMNRLDQQKTITKQVSDEKDQLKDRIDKAALLTTLNIRATGVKITRGGKKSSETNKASKADKIQLTFDVAENKLTAPGPKDIYIRVMTPDGQELTQSKDASHQFSFGGSTGFYAAKKTIDYANQPMSVLILIDKANNQDFVPGKYIIEINADKTTIGTTTMTLE